MTIPLWSIQLQGTAGYLDLTVANGITVELVTGAGMAPTRTVGTRYGIADGALFQRHGVEPGTVQIVMSVSGASMTNLHSKRAQLISAVHPHRSQPIRLWYCRDQSDAKFLDCVYDGGLDGGQVRGYTEKIPLRLWAGDPYWYGTAATATLAVRQVLNTCNFVAVRSSAGTWSNMNGGVDNTVYALVRTSAGVLYVGGLFHTAGAVAVRHIAYWDGAWGTLGVGLNNSVRDMALAPNGDLYAAGAFTSAGGGAANHVARWNGSAWAALGAGVDSTAHGLVFGADGKLYVTGAFANAGGAAAAKIARWTGAVWSSLGTGLSGNGNVLARGPDGSIYVGGEFTTAGGLTVNRIARWNPSDSTWHALGSGVNGNVHAIALAPNGQVCIGGEFTTAGNVPAVRVARWNGASWSGLGNGFSGVSAFIRSLKFDADGNLWAGGYFATSGSRVLPMHWALWVDPVWVGGDGNMTGWEVQALICETVTALGGNFTGALTFSGYNTIANPGSARVRPTFTIHGPGRWYHLVNHSNGCRLDFNLLLVTGETVTLNLAANTFTSSFRGDLQNAIVYGGIPGWYLDPGTNFVSVWVDDAGATGSYTFRSRYWSVDGASA